MQVASIFQALGSRVQLFKPVPASCRPRMRTSPPWLQPPFASQASCARTSELLSRSRDSSGVCMTFTKEGRATAQRLLLRSWPSGWVADTAGLNLPAAGVQTNVGAYVRVQLQAVHITLAA